MLSWVEHDLRANLKVLSWTLYNTIYYRWYPDIQSKIHAAQASALNQIKSWKWYETMTIYGFFSI